MLYKTIIVLFSVAVAGLALPSEAFARGGGHGGFHRGGGFHGGGFRGGGFRGGGFRGAGFGLGFYGPYGYYPFRYEDNDDDGCYLVRQRIHTRHGWRVRLLQICD
jgi:hypothetical protein